jgi:hypothetical protein
MRQPNQCSLIRTFGEMPGKRPKMKGNCVKQKLPAEITGSSHEAKGEEKKAEEKFIPHMRFVSSTDLKVPPRQLYQRWARRVIEDMVICNRTRTYRCGAQSPKINPLPASSAAPKDRNRITGLSSTDGSHNPGSQQSNRPELNRSTQHQYPWCDAERLPWPISANPARVIPARKWDAKDTPCDNTTLRRPPWAWTCKHILTCQFSHIAID